MQIIFHKKADQFFWSLEDATLAKARQLLLLLETHGHELQMPYVKWIKKDVYELRIRARQEVRFFFTFFQESIFILHGFLKTSNKIPKHELKTVLARLKTLHET